MNTHELLKVQHYEPTGTDGSVRLVKNAPYVRLTRGAESVFVKGGGVYGEGGVVVDPLPEWFWAEARKLSPASREAIGLRLPEDTAKVEPQVTPRVEVMPTWTCPQCDETVAMKRKGVHIAKHRKAARTVEVAGRV